MEKAKAAVSGFISKAGHHDTEVREHVAPAVKHEVVKPHEREERQVALDREIHQEHYHTTVQPVKDREVLPEQHHHNVVPVEHRTLDKRDTTETDQHLQSTKAQFKDELVRQETAHTVTAAPTVAGEHVHHHIHETIQPVIQKETIEPHVMHTTIPVHEVHHEKAQHHAASALPAMTMEEFKKSGGSLSGREERVDHFTGTPKNIEQSLGKGGASGIRDSGYSSGSHIGSSHSSATTGTGLVAGATGAAAASLHHGNEYKDGQYGEFSHRHAPRPVDGVGTRVSGEPALGSSHHSHETKKHSHETEKHKKPSLMDKLNPKKDSDGDGKPGFMD